MDDKCKIVDEKSVSIHSFAVKQVSVPRVVAILTAEEYYV